MTTPSIGSRLSLAAVILVSVVVAACGGDSPASADLPAPTGLTFAVNPAVYTVGTAITANSPSSSGGAVASYSVSPALPAGLSLNTTNGVISGTPTAVVAIATYTVTATNFAGSATVGLTITVNAAVVAPTGLTYAVNPVVYTVGTAITANAPSSSGGAVASYSVSPTLPAGLSLNTTTGAVSGTPTAVAAIATYTVTATNSAGSATVGLTITVNAAVVAPTELTYAVNPAVYTVGTAITANTPSSSGGAVASYSVSPTLPAGLSLNTTTGAVSGTPTAVAAIATYTVTATNSAGSATAGLSITVNPGPNIAVSPQTASVAVGGTAITFTATIENTAGPVLWDWPLQGFGSLSSNSGTTVVFSPPLPNSPMQITSPIVGNLTASVEGVSTTIPITIHPAGGSLNEVEYNDDYSHATPFGLFDGISGSLSNAADIDWFKIPYTSGGQLDVTFDVSGAVGGVWNVYWYDPDMINMSGINASAGEKRTTRIPASKSGYYFVRVQVTAAPLYGGGGYVVSALPAP